MIAFAGDAFSPSTGLAEKSHRSRAPLAVEFLHRWSLCSFVARNKDHVFGLAWLVEMASLGLLHMCTVEFTKLARFDLARLLALR